MVGNNINNNEAPRSHRRFTKGFGRVSDRGIFPSIFRKNINPSHRPQSIWQRETKVKQNLAKGDKFNSKFDYIILYILLILGLLFLADASIPYALNIYSDRFFFIKRQIIWVAIGLIAFYISSIINYKIWIKLANVIYFISLIFLILLLIPGFHISGVSAKRWFDLGVTTFQPSELVKLTLSIYLAKVSYKNLNLLSYLFPIIITVGLIMLQPDLGTALIIMSIGFSQIYISGVSIKKLLYTFTMGVISTILLILTSEYRKNRLLTFLNISKNPLNEGYHIRQILIALGSGGLFGVGLGKSRQKYLFLPESSTDSIFAVISEELGFIGASLLLLIFTFLIIRLIKIVKFAPDKFSMILSVGIISWLTSQIMLNVGSNVAFFPLTGVPLPFFSYGGTSIIMLLFALGILFNIKKYEKF